MRILPFLLLLALAARAEDWTELKAAVESGRFEEALRLADEARPANKNDRKLLWLRANAVVGVARGLQREKGYPAALAFYERRLDHEVIAYWYGKTCGWSGEEERGLDALRRCEVPATQRLHPELSLLGLLRRWEELIARATEIGGDEAPEWIEWAREESALRDRLAGRARTSVTLSLVVVGVAAAGLLFSLTRRPAT